MKKDQGSEVKSSLGDGEKPVSRISVRNLVEFLLREGDLDTRSQRGTDPEAALAGARIHRKLQKAQQGAYTSEAALRRDTEYEDLVIRVEGRADGIMEEDPAPKGGRRAAEPVPAEGTAGEALPPVLIDEIKGMYLDVLALSEPFPLHLAQAKCYAAIYAEQNGLEEIGVRMTYVNLETEELRYFYSRHPIGPLLEWFNGLVDGWYRWAKWELEHSRARNASMEQLEFPFPYREGQQKLTAAVYHTIREGRELFLMAPTGVGKTMSCVFPAVRAMGRGLGEKVFYLTAKNETQAAGREAFSILMDRGLDFRTLQITAKEKICPLLEPSCNPEDCPYAKGHFDRINDAVFDLLQRGELMTRELLLQHAMDRRVCPFELTLDTSSWCDAVLCDYNYVFDPDASLKRFFANGSSGDYIFLIDEAHNLVDRGREMYSAVLVKEHVLEAKRIAKGGDVRRSLLRSLERLNKLLLALKKDCLEGQETAVRSSRRPFIQLSLAKAGELLKGAQTVFTEMQTLYEECEDGKLKEELLDFFFEIRSFMSTSEYLDEHYVIYAGEDEEEHFGLKLFCVNPSGRLTEQIDKGRAAILFSATLLPLDYYRRLLTTREDPYAIYAPSPFKEERRLLMIAGDVSTRYVDRGEAMYRRIARYIAAAARSRAGNYLVFFPSYKMLRDVFQVYRECFDTPEVNWVLQSPGMREDDREIFLENFYEDPEHSLVGFCVMGGMFSEGLDLTGSRLIGAVIVGAGLPQLSNEQEILKQYYGREGFDYAYRFPGINKVEQAAGRVIRTATDLGVILLLDERLLGGDYSRLFPREWRDYSICTEETAEDMLRAFWDRWSGDEA